MFIYGLRLKTSAEYRYIGITSKSSARQRFVGHMSHSRSNRKQYPVNHWIRKNGFDSGVCMDILEDIPEEYGLEYLEESEKLWIWAMRYLGHDLLNISEGGRLPNGYKHSDEQKKLWSEQRKGSITGEKNPNYGKVGELNHLYGRSPSEATRKRISESKKGENNPNFGKSPSAETRLKQSQTTKGIPRPTSARSAHTRHHTNKDVSKPDTCKYCKEERDNE